MLAADTALELRTNRATLLDSHLNELTNTLLVQNLERVNLKNLLLQIYGEERSDIIT